jgi:pimeloyl-ACP methyl ester carboxylesterase
MPQRVLLVHGLLNSSFWLAPLAWRLRRAGFRAEIFGYPSVVGGADQAVARLHERLVRDPVDALVGHSLGGLVALAALRLAPAAPVSRVVCIGSPLLGSATAGNVAAYAWSRPLLGHSARLLREGLDAWTGPAQVGVVAGDVPRGMGRLFSRFEGASDGTVSIEETRLPGIADHCITHNSHTGLVFSAEAAAQAAHFLREGRFRH